jgi:hypothetical protein
MLKRGASRARPALFLVLASGSSSLPFLDRLQDMGINIFSDFSMSCGVGMDTVSLIERRLHRYSLENKRHENTVEFFRQTRVEGIELANIEWSEVADHLHPGEEHHDIFVL